jgi:hypothetical protein
MNTPSIPEWATRFDAFEKDPNNHELCHECSGALLDYAIKDFIKSEIAAATEGMEPRKNHFYCYSIGDIDRLLKAQTATLITAVEKMKNYIKTADEEWGFGHEAGYNEAINTILELLKGSDKK